VHSLVNCVSKNGNLLLNVGPDARGNIPAESIRILSEVGKWIEKNSESIYGNGASILAKPDWGRYTQKGNNIYAHWLYPNLGKFNAKGINGDKVKGVSMLYSGAELPYEKTWWGNTETGNLFINTFQTTEKPFMYDCVLKIEMK
jgi:alpha-L-fucosidase